MFIIVKRAYKRVIRWYKRVFLGINVIDVVEPTGTSSVIAGGPSGIHPHFNEVYRYMRQTCGRYDGPLGSYEALTMNASVKRVAAMTGEGKRRVFERGLDFPLDENTDRANDIK